MEHRPPAQSGCGARRPAGPPAGMSGVPTKICGGGGDDDDDDDEDDTTEDGRK